MKTRAALQRQLDGALQQLNQRNAYLASPYTLTPGDEFQAVLNRADHLFHDICTLLAALHPQRIRFSMAAGLIARVRFMPRRAPESRR